MKSYVLLPLLACGVIAQDHPREPKIPRPPSVGRHEKVFEAPAPPASAPDATAIANTGVRAPERRLPAKEQGVVDAGRKGIQGAFEDPDFLAFDEPPAGGPIWAVGRHFKVSFDAQGFTFIGQPAAEATSLQPIRFHLDSAKVGSRNLELLAANPVRTDRRIAFQRGALVEAIDLNGRGAEQTFTFAELPQRGEIVIDLAVDTQLQAENGAAGIVFRGPFDEVSYSAAIAIDANGNRIAAPTTFGNGHVTIRVPAAFVESAALPLCIDPWIHAVTVSTSTNDLADPDLAWDSTGNVWGVVWARYFGGSDWDCYVQRIAPYNPMTLVGGVTVIDGGTDAWQRPRIANLGVYDVFMVVCQVKSGTTPWKVSGRIMANSGPVQGNQFVINSGGVDDYHPDVGGDPGGAPTYFTVVWEHAYSATDHDIYARQVDATGVLRGTSPTYVQTNTTNQSWPTVSKSDGPAPYDSQRYTIVYQQTASAGNEDIYASMLTWDGVFVTVAGGNTFLVDGLGYNDVFPQASSPTLLRTDGLRLILMVYERTSINGGDIAAVCMDQAGNWRGSGNISILENDPFRLPWPQYRPSVDCDGTRFVVGYHEVFQGNTSINDLDTRVSLVALAGNTLLIEEPGVQLAYSQNREFNMQVATEYGGSGVASPRANTVHDRDSLGTGFGIECYSYDSGPVGRFDTRSTACGSLGITPSGQPVIGNTVSFAVTASPYLSGVVVGFPASLPVAPCPSCTVGVNGTAVLGANYSIAIANNPVYIGFVLSVQGFVFHGLGGPCLGQIRLSDTVDMTIH